MNERVFHEGMQAIRAWTRYLEKWFEAHEAREHHSHGAGRMQIQVTAVELKPEVEEVIPMPPVDHMQPLQLPSSTVRAKLAIVDPRDASGQRVTSITWSSSDSSQVSLESIPEDTVKIPDPNWVDPGDGSSAPLVEKLDPTDSLPLKVFSVYANTPLDAGKATVTANAAGVAPCDIEVAYSDPPVGHMAINAMVVPE